jgi:dephospho-CoA kinase
LVVGLTGGIGAGKSAALDRFTELGAVVVDSDDVAREVVAAGTPGLAEVASRFGPDMLAADGTLDRARLAGVVFADADARAALEGIVHPRVRAEVRRRVAAAPAGSIVVNAVPLLAEAGLAGDYDLVVVIEAPVEARIARLAATRGMTRGEALQRIEAQADDVQRRSVAWRVIVNDTTLDALRARVDGVWRELVAHRDLAHRDLADC